MKARSTLILFLLVALLGGYVFLFEKKKLSTRELEQKTYTLTHYDQDKITGLDLSNGDSAIQLRRKNGQWMLVSPVQDRVNLAAITPILVLASDIGRYSTIDKLPKNKVRETQKEYGVQKAKVRLRLLGDGAPAEIHFGKDTAFEGKIYARLETDDDISVIKSDLRNLVIKDLSDFRDRHLTHFEASKVSQVLFKTPSGEIDLAQTGDDWNLSTPIKARAANGKVLDLIASINNLTIEEFITPDEANLAKYGLAEPRGTITFQARDSDDRETIEIGTATEKNPDKIYVRVLGRPSIFVVAKTIGAASAVKPNDLRDNKLTRVPEDLVDRLTIDKPGAAPLVFAREQDHWKSLSDGQPANGDAIKRLIDILNNTETLAFVDDTAAELPPYGLDQPVLTVKLSSYSTENTAEAAKGETPLATIQFGKTEGTNVYARIIEEPFVVSVGSGILANIASTAAAYLPK